MKNIYIFKLVAGFAVFAILLTSSPALVLADDPPASEPDVVLEGGAPAPPAPAPEGVDGTDGASGTGGDASVVTGGALSTTDTYNQVNTSDTDTSTDAPVGTTTIQNLSETLVATFSTSTGDTGSNAAVSDGGGALIVSGGSMATANVINVVNTNITNSTGMLAFINALFGGGLDLRTWDLSYFFGGPSGDPECTFLNCGQTLTVGNDSDAVVQNAIVVRSQTGANFASSTGDALIGTGDAYAAANLVNVVNTNILNSNYFLLAFNNFGTLGADITLPNADFFMRLLGGGGGQLPPETTIENDNTASVTNDLDVGSDTGGNAASSTEGQASVTTGSAYSGSATYNQLNTNLVGGATFFMLVNVFGTWSGDVHGLPEGISWVRTPTGIMLTSDDGDFSDLTAGAGSGLASLEAKNKSTATVQNDVSVWALTGDNNAHSSSSTAAIDTGNAYAAANVVNLVNTNVIGQNWMLAILNIFGDWNGNLSFGHPDLWIGGVAEAGNPAMPGSEVLYHFTVANHGDADATEVVLTASFDDRLSFEDAPGQRQVRWNLGRLARGETREYVYRARAGSNTGAALLRAELRSRESDNDPADNTEQLAVVVGVPPHVSSAGSTQPGAWTSDPNIVMTKTASAPTSTTPGSVDYKLVLRNSGGHAYQTKLVDTLSGPSGVVNTQNWTLATILPGEEVIVTYTVQFGPDFAPGVYTNTATLTGQTGNAVAVYAHDMTTVEAVAQVELVPGGIVAGAESMRPACAAFVTSFIKPGARNDAAQVKRLQFFLRDFEGAAVTPSGVYDTATRAAVKAFQLKYASDVLTPWGLTSPSGAVYYTTQSKINDIYCQGVARFPLTDKQKSEVQAFRGVLKYLAPAKKPAGGVSGR